MVQKQQAPVDYDNCLPDASAMIESMRAHGYTLSTAIADLIDNSIAAGASKVWIDFRWEKSNSYITITDNGSGMDESNLREAMKLGSQNPLIERDIEDLGRFGLGLKTASFSQARRLTVVSRKKGKTSLRRWDLDHLSKPEIEGWQLLKSPHDESINRINKLVEKKIKSGTEVLLERLDRVIGDLENIKNEGASLEYWSAKISEVRTHVGMVFHRFLSAPGKQRLMIFVNDVTVDSWDPFQDNHPATNIFASDRTDALSKGTVELTGFVLPHRDMFKPDNPEISRRLHEAAAGPKGWNAHQGFYVYRNKRLIIDGDWLGLGPGTGWKKEEHYKLARIRLDIPNSTDHEWQIDVKKSSASVPPALKKYLEGMAKTVREEAKKVYAFRGGIRNRKRSGNVNDAAPWESRLTKNGQRTYRIDRKHPTVSAVLKSVEGISRKAINSFLVLIEQTVPVQRIWIDSAENPDAGEIRFTSLSETQLRDTLVALNKVMAAQTGLSPRVVWSRMEEDPAFQSPRSLAIISALKEQEDD
ncbi:ATP-binding protein [Gammaproteobacteria bacterium]|nr:ATP-binding protein [Gammaproteobacteria bacterium]